MQRSSWMPPIGLAIAVVALAAGTAGTAGTAGAQGFGELSRATVETERDNIVSRSLRLSEKVGGKFWPLYREYQAEKDKIVIDVEAILERFRIEFDTMSNERARDLLEQYQKTDNQRLKLRNSYLKKFGKILSGRKLVRFFQIDNKLDTIIDYDLAKNVPLIR